MKMDGRACGRRVLLSQKLANQTLIRPVSFCKVSRMGLMMGACITGNVRRERLVVVMKGRKKHDRQDNR